MIPTGVPVPGVIHDARLPGVSPSPSSATVRILLPASLLLAGLVDLAVLDAIVLPRFLALKTRTAIALPMPKLAPPPVAPSVASPTPPVAIAPQTPAPAQPAASRPEALPALHFKRNAAILNKDARATLANLYAILTARPELQVSLNGHTDDLGPPPVNTLLSLRRARVAQTWLVAHGIDSARITIQSFGATAPLGGVIIPSARPQNRRVEIEFR